MKRALIQLVIKPDITLIDGNFAPEGIKNYKTIINGDEKVKAISAASIIAKHACGLDILTSAAMLTLLGLRVCKYDF